METVSVCSMAADLCVVASRQLSGDTGRDASVVAEAAFPDAQNHGARENGDGHDRPEAQARVWCDAAESSGTRGETGGVSTEGEGIMARIPSIFDDTINARKRQQTR
jgi:hypothetical protein